MTHVTSRDAETLDRTPESITADELKRMLSSRSEREYVLFDVRQPEEYEAGHIPGARLLPLPEYENRLEEVWRHRDRTLIFYCSHGPRSKLAARLTASGLRVARVYSLLGGLQAWRGEAVAGCPTLRVFSLDAGAVEILTAAMDLEKGVHRFYQALSAQFADTPYRQALQELTDAEVAHGRALYAEITRLSGPPAESFTAMFERLPGELLETGQSWDAWLRDARQLDRQGTVALLEFALTLELTAYDLYKNLSDRAGLREARDAFLLLARQERVHADAIAQQIASAARS